MVDCEYCAESFDGDDAYLDHLADTHDGELGAIDRRRVDEHTGGKDDGALPIGPIVIGIVVVFAIGLTVYVTQLSGGDGGNDADLAGTAGAQPLSAVEASGVEASPLDGSGDSDRLAGVEQFPDRGTDHVEEGSAIDYQRVPPLSGTHYASTVDAGFYEATPLLGSLVHTLEHGAVDCHPIAALYKQQVRQLAKHIGVPDDLAEKTASAEMWAGQTDTDEMGMDYDTLDSILALHIDGGVPAAATAEHVGVPIAAVETVREMYESSAHKRAMPPGPDPLY